MRASLGRHSVQRLAVMFWFSVEHKSLTDPFAPARFTALCSDREWWAAH
jgi:hypothetical protein